MPMQSIEVPLSDRSYSIDVDAGLLTGAPRASAAALLRPDVEERCCVVVTDDNVGPLYLDALESLLRESGAAAVHALTFPAGERFKTLETVAGFYGPCVRAGLDRRGVIVALGGGVTGDLAGYLAATYMRGVAFIQVPTSLLAQVDSSVGGKTGVDLPEGKNLVGAFKQPRRVLVDLDTLRTLPMRELRAGLAEVVKYGVVFDAALFADLEGHVEQLLGLDRATLQRVVSRCCALKAEVVAADELDRDGRRAVLNYGHTFGHALELVGGYETLNHGEAIAVGMMMAADLAARRDPALGDVVARQERLWTAIGLPVRTSAVALEAVLEAMRADKKSERGAVRLILPAALGRCELVADATESEVLEAIRGRCD